MSDLIISGGYTWLFIIAGVVVFLVILFLVMPLNAIITLVRLPFGLISIVFIAIVYLLMLPIEALIVLIWLPFAAVFMPRRRIAGSWAAQFPNTIRRMVKSISVIWEWVFGDDDDDDNDPGYHIVRARDWS